MSLERQEFRKRSADHSLGGNGERAGSMVNYESISEDQDCCPYCRRPLEILFVKFRIRGTAIIASCANCGIARADEWRAAESKALDKAKKLARNTWSLWQGSASSMVSLNRQFRYVPTFLLGALITAAALRPRAQDAWDRAPQNTMRAVFEWRGKNYVVSHSSVQLRIHTEEGIKVC